MSITQAILGKIFQSAGKSPSQKEMSFLEHLDELRSKIIKTLIGILVGTILCVFFADFIVQNVLLHPLRSVGLKVQVLSPYYLLSLDVCCSWIASKRTPLHLAYCILHIVLFFCRRSIWILYFITWCTCFLCFVWYAEYRHEYCSRSIRELYAYITARCRARF